ncbi:hypothetical protein ID866_5157 [Astraeus odoratus]|nr:hypothetical protein ID866_5157 [Astraeus odoratus]
MPTADPGPTPTVAQPFPTTDSSFSFPPLQHHDEGDSEAVEDEEKEQVRRAALEFMVSLSEARPVMVRRVEGWTSAIVRACLEGMAEMPEDTLEAWLETDLIDRAQPADDVTDESYPLVYDQALDRLSIALGGKEVLPPAFQHIPSMLASYDWRQRHAGLMAIAAIAEGTSKVMQVELGKVVDLVTPMFKDTHPRVRYAAWASSEIIQENHHKQLFSALIPTLEAQEHRVHAHAAAALINFCEGVEHDTLVPYLDPIVERLLKMLNVIAEDGKQEKSYCQEQAITSLAMVADASEATFAKVAEFMKTCRSMLTLCTEHQKLRVKAMECAGLIAIAVGRDIFRPDSRALISALINIQNSPVDPSDTMLATYLIATWAKICQALGTEFEPYLPVVMPPLLNAASAKADVSIYDEGEASCEREGWETISMDGQIVGIRTSTIDEKCQAFDTLVIYCSILGSRFGPYLTQSLELTLPALQFYFHEGVREAACRLIPLLLSCGKNSGTLTPQMVSASLRQIIQCLRMEADPSFVASLYRSMVDSLLVVGMGALTPELAEGVLEATKSQLTTLADKRKVRSTRPVSSDLADDQEELALLEEMEDFALEDMEKFLRLLDLQHPLLIAVASVRDLGVSGQWESEDDGGSER